MKEDEEAGMASPARSPQEGHLDTLENYLISMARTVEVSTSRVLGTLLDRGSAESEQTPGQIFMQEPRINEMEMVIDEHAVRLLREGRLAEREIRQVVATLKITNDLERMGDLAVGLAERVVSLAGMPEVNEPAEMRPMVTAVSAMVNKSLGALTFRNVALANEVLESDDLVDRYRDLIFEALMTRISEQPSQAAPSLQLVLASRYLERLADHATNIAEDIIFWVRGLDVRHGRGRGAAITRGVVAENL
jgi:phosphate transport system protein